ncbi:MAG: hypothetical protein RLZZ70_184 [Candidatus Parcubacteria bacterium]
MATTRKKTATVVETRLTKVQLRRIATLGTVWQLDDKHKKLVATFDFDRYLDGFMFATKVFVHAEVMNHHPEVCITESSVKVTLTTHDTKGVSDLDIALAERINQLLSPRS